MIKKCFMILFTLLLTLSLGACSKDSEYKITKARYSTSNDKLICEISYPQLSGLGDNEEKINSILKEEALKVLKYYENPYGFVEVSVDYEAVLKSPSLLSIKYSGFGSVSNAAHPNSLFFTTSINTKTGDRIRLKDVVTIDSDFSNKFLNGSFKAVHSEHSKVLNRLSIKDIQKIFNEADSLDTIGTDKQSDVFSYFTNDSLVISISVGHALGDHAEFEIKYQDLKDSIKNENKIWK